MLKAFNLQVFSVFKVHFLWNIIEYFYDLQKVYSNDLRYFIKFISMHFDQIRDFILKIWDLFIKFSNIIQLSMKKYCYCLNIDNYKIITHEYKSNDTKIRDLRFEIQSLWILF